MVGKQFNPDPAIQYLLKAYPGARELNSAGFPITRSVQPVLVVNPSLAGVQLEGAPFGSPSTGAFTTIPSSGLSPAKIPQGRGCPCLYYKDFGAAIAVQESTITFNVPLGEWWL